MMEPERDGSNIYPWILYDPNEFYKPWSVQTLPELEIKRNFKHKSHFHVLVNVNNISVDEVSMKYDKDYLIIQGDYKEKKDQGYECHTAFNIVRRIKLPKNVDMKNVDTWTTKNGCLNILAPIDDSPNNDGLVTIHYPCANSKTVTDIAKRTLNCVQEFRFETMLNQLESIRTPCPPAASQPQPENTHPPAGQVRPSAGQVRPSVGNKRGSAGKKRGAGRHVCSSARNPRVIIRNVQSSAGNTPRGTIRAPNRAPTGNIRAVMNTGAMARNMNNMYYSAPRNTYGPADNAHSSGAAPMMRSGGNMERGLSTNNYNHLNYDYNTYEDAGYAQGMHPSDYIEEFEEIALGNNTYYVIPSQQYIYAREMDPSTINE